MPNFRNKGAELSSVKKFSDLNLCKPEVNIPGLIKVFDGRIRGNLSSVYHDPPV